MNLVIKLRLLIKYFRYNENEISENSLVVFGNLPYNISTEILLKWIFSLRMIGLVN